jgi:hypothetical protein
MQFFALSQTGVRISVALAAVLCLCAQEPATATKDARSKDAAQGLPPRVSPGEYQTQAKAGNVTIAADFDGHSVPTGETTLTTEEYVIIELGLYGPAEARMQISLDDFTLRINGKKVALRPVPSAALGASLKDPEYVAPDAVAAQKSKTSLNGGGGNSNDPPPVIHIPLEVQRSWAQQARKASLPLGDRALPQAGLLFFQFRGKVQNISEAELIYSGSAGKATIKLRL